MGIGLFTHRGAALAAIAVFVSLLAGCQTAATVSSSQLIQHQAMIDFSGLTTVKTFANVKAQIAPPEKWDRLNVERAAMYTDQQWRSPSHHTAVGVAYVRLPLPLAAKVLVWIAEQEYTKKSKDGAGKIVARWTDNLGREWFEAENAKYHVRGYVVATGLDAWFVYCGYKTTPPQNPVELSLAARSLESVVPMLARGK